MTGRVLLPLFLTLVVGSGAAGSLEPDRVQHRPIARREPRPPGESQVLLGATGELVEKAAHVAGLPPWVHGEPEPLGDDDTCNFDYLAGVTDRLGCSDPHTHSLILDPAVCRWAARVTGTAVMSPATFLIAHVDYNLHPRGCFKAPCTPLNTTECYFYNDCDDSARTGDIAVAGTPVCTRDKYVNGTENGCANLPTAAAAVYELIPTDTECSEVAGCLGYTEAANIRVDAAETNVHRYDLYPQGCFINHDDRLVYFNAFTSTMAVPTAPVGTALCKVPGVTG